MLTPHVGWADVEEDAEEEAGDALDDEEDGEGVADEMEIEETEDGIG